MLGTYTAGPHHGNGAGSSQRSEGEGHRGVCSRPALLQRTRSKGLIYMILVMGLVLRAGEELRRAVIAEYFHLLMCQEVKDQSSSVLEGEEIRWVITVPAVWRQPAKQFMREAAYLVRTHLHPCLPAVKCPKHQLHRNMGRLSLLPVHKCVCDSERAARG